MLLYLTLAGFLISILVLINLRNSNKANIYLLFFLLINNIYALSHYAAVYSQNKYLTATMLVHFTPFYLLLGPLFYFYIRSLLMDDFKLSKKDYLHFIPAFIILINILPYIFKGVDYKLAYATGVIAKTSNLLNFDYLLIPPFANFLFRPIHALFYVAISIVLILKNRLNLRNNNLQQSLIYKWLLLLISISTILYVSFMLFSVFSYIKLDYKLAVNQASYILYITIGGLIVLNFSLLFFPNILYGLPQLDYRLSTKKVSYKKLDETEETEEKRISKSFEISDDKLLLLKSKIDSYLLIFPYLKPNFNLSMMSSETDIPVHHLSYFFNEYMKINFNTWKNDLKIEYVLELMKDGTYENLTLDALSKKAGFGSRSSFINSFKSKTGLTPSEYLQNLD
jgi:AraC-like DNA-binding protein